MTIKEIRKMTGLTQEKFAKEYNIPLSTLKQWESKPGSSSFHNPPQYVPPILERLVKLEKAVGIEKEYQKEAKELVKKRIEKYQELMDLL